MSSQLPMSFCDVCKRDVAVRRQPMDITAQVVFSLFTFGLWLPIWYLLWRASPMVCAECGHVIASRKA